MKRLKSKFIKSLDGRNDSGVDALNFLWKCGSIYIMDNHKAALWCWLQHWFAGQRINFLHIDMHNDFCDDNSDCDGLFDILELSAKSVCEFFSAIKHPETQVEMIRWDNYIWPFFHMIDNSYLEAWFATHELNELGDHDLKIHSIEMYDLPVALRSVFSKQCGNGIIVNLDLDYFVYETDGVAGKQYLHSSAFRNQIYKELRMAINEGKILCLTVALSPECCGGWDMAEKLAHELSESLEIPFILP